ncbi:hypothetical protein [Streptomyces sp. UG1]|uniref:hypothetical protein n=1 Tax=Streptomyces sp. UG1 TaxID=3417652 RepID=UPI003CF2C18E
MRDRHHRPAAHLPGRRRGRGAFVGEPLAHPVKDTFGDGEFVPLGSYLRQLFGQLFFELVQFRTARSDPFQASLILWEVSVDSTVCRAHQHGTGARRNGALQKEPPGGVREEPRTTGWAGREAGSR